MLFTQSLRLTPYVDLVLLILVARVTAQQAQYVSDEVGHSEDSGSRIAKESEQHIPHSGPGIPLHKENDVGDIHDKSYCYAKVDGEECIPLQVSDEKHEQEDVHDEGDKYSLPSKLYHRGMEGLGEMLGQVEKSRAKVIRKLEGVMDQVAHSKDQMMKGFDNVMDKVSESMSESKVRVIKSFDKVMDKVTASKLMVMEEIDYVIEEIKALPGELRESFVLSVRNRSYIAAGVMVAVTAAILIAGAVYFAWCHHDAWSYHRVPLDEHLLDSDDGTPVTPAKFAASEATSDCGEKSKPATNGSSVHHRKPKDADIKDTPGSHASQANGVEVGDHKTISRARVESTGLVKLCDPATDLTQSQSAVENEASGSEHCHLEEGVACSGVLLKGQTGEDVAAQGSDGTIPTVQNTPSQILPLEKPATNAGTSQDLPVSLNQQEPVKQGKEVDQVFCSIPSNNSRAKEAHANDKNLKEAGARNEQIGDFCIKTRFAKGENDFKEEASTRNGESETFELSSEKTSNIPDKLSHAGNNGTSGQSTGAGDIASARR